MRPKIEDPLKQLSEVYKPDERQTFLAESLEDVHAQLSRLALHDRVPVDIAQLFETAKNVRLYAYFVFRFHQVAEMVAYQALEFALRKRWLIHEQYLANNEQRSAKKPPHGLKRLLKDAAKMGWLRNECFSGRQWRAYNAIRSQRILKALSPQELLANGPVSIPEPTKAEIEELAKHIDAVQLIVNYLPQFRNDLAHGSALLMPRSTGLLQDICDILNMLFDKHEGNHEDLHNLINPGETGQT